MVAIEFVRCKIDFSGLTALEVELEVVIDEGRGGRGVGRRLRGWVWPKIGSEGEREGRRVVKEDHSVCSWTSSSLRRGCRWIHTVGCHWERGVRWAAGVGEGGAWMDVSISHKRLLKEQRYIRRCHEVLKALRTPDASHRRKGYTEKVSLGSRWELGKKNGDLLLHQSRLVQVRHCVRTTWSRRW